MMSETPLSVGMIGASGGRSIPRILPTITCPPTKIAPELPAETNAFCLFVFYHIHSHYDRGIFLFTDRIDRRLGSFDNLFRMYDSDLVFRILILSYLFLNDIFLSYQDHFYVVPHIDCVDRTFHHLARRMISAHRV